MSAVPSSKLIKKEILDEDIPKAWKIICDELRGEGKDFRNLSMNPNKKLGERWFHASSINDVIFIEGSWKHPEESKIKGKYHIYYPDFETTARHYNSYVLGISNDIRYSGSHMTTYEITLIAELL